MFICKCNIHTYFYGSNEIKDFCEKCKKNRKKCEIAKTVKI